MTRETAGRPQYAICAHTNEGGEIEKKLRRRRAPWLAGERRLAVLLAHATKAAALVGAQRRRLQPTTKAVELVCPNMRLLAAYCLMGTVAAPRAAFH